MTRLPAGLSSPRDTEPRPSPMDQANLVTSLLLILRMLHSRRVLYKSFSVPASVEHPFFFLPSPEETIEQEVWEERDGA